MRRMGVLTAVLMSLSMGCVAIAYLLTEIANAPAELVFALSVLGIILAFAALVCGTIWLFQYRMDKLKEVLQSGSKKAS